MEIEFVKLSPTENMTVLVKTPVPRDKQLETGVRLIQYSSVYAEQADFIEKPQNPMAEARLQMMAGEFCGNGTMAMAAYIARQKGLKPGEGASIALEVSGADGILTCEIEAAENGYRAAVEMPKPDSIAYEDCGILGQSLPVVCLPGIKHIIVSKELLGDKFKDFLEGHIEELKKQILCDAFGIIVFDEKNMRIDPLVIVKSADSLFWERGCGSGSEAVGIYLSWRDKRDVNIGLGQPGGIIDVSVKYNNGIESVSIAGNVYIAAEGRAYI